MILIVESGSSKSDIIGLNTDGSVAIRFQTLGLNPEILSNDTIVKIIQELKISQSVSDSTSHIYFYGAGCGTPKAKEQLSVAIASLFKYATIAVYEDTYAACFACNPSLSESIICILGTGSNCSYFDGKQLVQKITSLGYMIMDDAGGVSFGRKLLRAYYFNQLPLELKNIIDKTHDLDADTIKNNLYKKPSPNAYLASFTRFIINHKSHPFIKQLIENEFQEFIDNQIKQFDNHAQVSVHFVGSVAYFLQEELKNVASRNNIQIGNIIQKPIEKLIEFHQKQIQH
ncbi:MAG: N-acetylglucosamine kinase [Bacteroidota bacterium]|nr:N-acetylglucosamine kinase [Bacteroidota bacterium]